ncbi:hypothetical protein [Rathayibacter sp. AY1F9]|uniref:hypothetical protein n=1 Tax=Rathayibacter sp. AY1F9 TaxID=2080563 RepID=UPI0015E40742|nr:hypothetical protein [Rathayibacter sp. AY1F9]
MDISRTIGSFATVLLLVLTIIEWRRAQTAAHAAVQACDDLLALLHGYKRKDGDE